MSSPKNLFITGVSSGLGRALAQEALAAGHRVVGTVRSGEAKLDFEALDSAKTSGRVPDVTQFDAIDAVVAEAETSIGPIDVLVNNAGYGHEGVMEESPLAEMRRQFDVNVFGAVAPGAFRTDWAGRSMVRTPRTIADYDAQFDPIRNGRKARIGKQIGDPVRATQAMMSIIDSPSPPTRLLLGSDALSLVREQLAATTNEMAAWEALSRSTDG